MSMASMNIDDVLEGATHKAQKAQGESVKTFLTSLTTSAVICALVIVAVTFLKSRFPKFYRTRTQNASTWQVEWLWPRMIFFPMSDPNMKAITGLDNYLFERYLHTILRIFIPMALVLLPILLPLSVIDGKNESSGFRGLDRLTFGNIGLSHTDWYWAHLAMAICTVLYVSVVLRYELEFYARLRQKITPARDVSTRSTILLTSSSKIPLTIEAIRLHFGTFSGGVCAVRINRDQQSFVSKIQRRDKLIAKLEVAETNLIKKANTRGRTKIGAIRTQEVGEGSIQTPVWENYLHSRDRPSMRLPIFGDLMLSPPLLGTKVDTIYYCRTEIVRTTIAIEHDRQNWGNLPSTNSAFVQFNNRILSPPVAGLTLKARIPPSWTIKKAATYNDIIWANVSLSWWELFIRRALVGFLVTLLVLGFAFPVFLIGSVSQIAYLANVVPWLSWVDKIPSWLIAAVQGFAPTMMLALINSMVPIAIRLLAGLQGFHSHRAVESSIQLYYFTFLFVQVFLIVSVSTGIATSLEEIPNALISVPATLAQNLPKASNYFFSYIIIFTFGTITVALMRVETVVQLAILSPLFDKTPRDKWIREEKMLLKRWGTFIPIYTNIACIGLIYSVIAPLILPFSIFCFGLLWILYRYNPPNFSNSASSFGKFYPRAIRQLYIGLYFMELCLVGLFFLIRNSDNKAAGTGQGICMTSTVLLTLALPYISDDRWKRLKLSAGFKDDGFGLWEERGRERTRGERRFDRSQNQKMGFGSHAYSAQDELLKSARSVIWIPRDRTGIGADESEHLMRYNDCLIVSNDGAYIDSQGRIILHGVAPDCL